MVQAVIMAGGEGSRLRPLTCDRPKPMVPILNRPVMEYAVELLKKHGITDIGVTLQYMPRDIISHFRDGSGHGVNMQFFIEESPLGTAGSVKNASGFLNDTFIVVSGDALTDFDLSAALKFHREKGALATLVLTPVEIPLEYGVVITEETGAIRQFLEKPGWGEVFSDTVNTGIYILEPEVLNYIPAGKKFDFSKDLFPFLLKEKMPLFGVSLRGYWCDVGNLKQYQEAHYAALEGRVSINMAPAELRSDNIYVGHNSTIDPSAVLEGPVFIGSNCHIGRNVLIGPYTVLGNNCRVDDGASLKKAVIWDGTYIARRAEIRGAVICNKVTVKDRAVVLEGAVIGDGSILEEDVKIRPDTKVWPYKTIEKAAVLDNHLIWGTRACSSLFGSDGIAGKVNINLTPECAAKLGAVYGSTLGREPAVLISCDSHRSTQMIKSAFQAGLMSMGVRTIDGGSLLTPVHRYAVRSLGVRGGVHIKSAQNDPELIHINFFNDKGATVSRDIERKIENLFERDDFQRRAGENVGTVTYMPGLTEAYAENLFRLVDMDAVRSRRFRILAHFTGEGLNSVLPAVFHGLGAEFHNTAVEGSPQYYRLESVAEALAPEIPKFGADFGIVLDNNGERAVFIDERGHVVNEDIFSVVMSLIIMETSARPVVAVPVTGSSAIDRIARSTQGRVIRTKTSPVSLMSEVMNPEIAEAQGLFNQSVIIMDAISTTVKVMEYMAVKGKYLSELLAEIPEIHMIKKETDCPWKVKGKVIRQLIEETRDKNVELLDGIKVYHDGGWALILPDAGEPKYHVYAEGSSYEFADELAGFYIDKINELKKGI